MLAGRSCSQAWAKSDVLPTLGVSYPPLSQVTPQTETALATLCPCQPCHSVPCVDPTLRVSIPPTEATGTCLPSHRGCHPILDCHPVLPGRSLPESPPLVLTWCPL